MESAQTCPVRSTSMQELIAVTFGFSRILDVLLTNDTSHITEKNSTFMYYICPFVRPTEKNQ